MWREHRRGCRDRVAGGGFEKERTGLRTRRPGPARALWSHAEQGEDTKGGSLGVLRSDPPPESLQHAKETHHLPT